MAKTKIHHLHKVKVHHNRWLLWAISYAVIVAFAVWGYIAVSDIDFENQFRAENSYVSSRSYVDNRLSFALTYPADWSIEASSDSTISFIPLSSNEEGVTVKRLALASERAIRNSLNIINEKTTIVDGISGVRISNDLGNGAVETVVLLKYAGNLYVVQGSSPLVSQALSTFRFLK